MSSPRPLRRPHRSRMIAGVVAAFADYFVLDLALARVLYAIGTIVSFGAGVLIYLACWILIPPGEDGP